MLLGKLLLMVQQFLLPAGGPLIFACPVLLPVVWAVLVFYVPVLFSAPLMLVLRFLLLFGVCPLLFLYCIVLFAGSLLMVQGNTLMAVCKKVLAESMLQTN